jgi:hypothetical protein
MKRYFIHNPLFRIVAPPIYGILIYLLILLLNNNVSQVNDLFVSQEVYVCIVLTYLSFEFIRLCIILISKFLRLESEGPRILFQFILTTGFSVFLIVAALKIYFNYYYGFSITGTQLLIFIAIFTVTGFDLHRNFYRYRLSLQRTIFQ